MSPVQSEQYNGTIVDSEYSSDRLDVVRVLSTTRWRVRRCRMSLNSQGQIFGAKSEGRHGHPPVFLPDGHTVLTL